MNAERSRPSSAPPGGREDGAAVMIGLVRCIKRFTFRIGSVRSPLA